MCFLSGKIRKRRESIIPLKKFFFFLLTFGIVLFDLGSKYFVKAILQNPFRQIVVIPHFFSIIYVKNYGLLFGFFHRIPLIIKIIVMVIGLSAVLFFVIKSYYSLNKLEIISLSFILGGGIGNLIDRIINGAVFDFLYFYIGKHSWPTFNFADSLIDVGIVLFILAQFIGRKGHASNIS